jgi:hypothetical protein
VLSVLLLNTNLLARIKAIVVDIMYAAKIDWEYVSQLLNKILKEKLNPADVELVAMNLKNCLFMLIVSAQCVYVFNAYW